VTEINSLPIHKSFPLNKRPHELLSIKRRRPA